MNSHSSRGFTMIEVLVVAAMISLLAAVILAYSSTSRGKGRDARRLTDMQSIIKALELYQNENKIYPGTGTTVYVSGTGTCVSTYAQISTILGAAFMPSIPKDPDSGRCYFYIPDAGAQGYKVFMQPDDSSWLAKDSGCTDAAAPAATYYCLQR